MGALWIYDETHTRPIVWVVRVLERPSYDSLVRPAPRAGPDVVKSPHPTVCGLLRAVLGLNVR